MLVILLIDDDIELRINASEILKLEDFEVLQASDGLEGLSMARDYLPDLIICDINMPEMDGYSVIQALRSDSMTATIPFIFLSAQTREQSIRTGMNLGADDYLTKPFNNDDLLNAVRSRLERSASYRYERLQKFARQIVTVQETERRNLSSTLKDKLVEMLLDLKLTLNLIDRLPPEAQSSTLQTSQTLLDHVMNEIDRLSHSLYPTTLHHLGLLPALYLLIDQLREQGQLTIHFENQGVEVVKNIDMMIFVYRIIQEGLQNIVKHADASEVNIRMWVEADHLRIQLIDDGIGFDIESALADPENTGLMGIRERAFLLNGELTILSDLKEGTQILADIPLSGQSKTPSRPLPLQRDDLHIPLPVTQVAVSVHDQTQVLIAEPNEITRWGIQNVVNMVEDFTVASQASTLEEMLDVLENTSIDIILLSQSFQTYDELQHIIQAVNQRCASAKIILVSSFVEYTYAHEALKQGIAGYILKTSRVEEIQEALVAVTHGKNYITPSIMATMKTQPQQEDTDGELDAFSTLTDREREIFYMVVNGQTNKDIAKKLVISPRTAETHRRNMMRKLGIRRTHNLIRFALDHNLIKQ